MIGDQDKIQFISESNRQDKKESKSDFSLMNKNNQLNNFIYFGVILTFTCIIMLLFWNVNKQNNYIQPKYIEFHKQNAHLILVSQEEVSNCNQTVLNEKTLVFVSNQIVKDDIKHCINHLQSQFSDILLIVYNAIQESILKENYKNVIQYYLSNKELTIRNQKIKKKENLEEYEQIEVIVQIINNNFK
ncbi:unnamed protein product [Paramecium sonneborni]|uniref:Transmembrane protein n=1 Tax=Paramecium sonneborni TaxID=65129 RepID=A0A8S1MH68_9CILI|nr:unnamed protein product [Paramecium sonneborni]